MFSLLLAPFLFNIFVKKPTWICVVLAEPLSDDP